MAASLRKVPPKGSTPLVVQLYRITYTVKVTGITSNYEEDYLRVYFANQKRSGGGKVHSVELLGCGEAIVTFEEYKG